MGKALDKWLKSKIPMDIREEALLNVRVASHFLESDIDSLCNKYGITSTQYNVLRILNGVYPYGHPRFEIISRMIVRAPDITRIIDRLEILKLVERIKYTDDRRISHTRITKKGRKLLYIMNPVISEAIKNITKNLSQKECKELSRMCEKIYFDKI